MEGKQDGRVQLELGVLEVEEARGERELRIWGLLEVGQQGEITPKGVLFKGIQGGA